MTPGQARRIALFVLLAAAVLILWPDFLLAQNNPFGVGRPPSSTPAAPAGGIVGWILLKQAEFYRAMSGTVRAAKTNGSALWTLMGIAFAYGVFHAAGPGHGKAVISSYMIANRETFRRGIVLSFASAFLQALVAVVVVGIAAVILNLTARQICDAERVIEIASYGLIALLGARLAWVKGRGLIRHWQDSQHDSSKDAGPMPASLSAAVTPREHLHDHAHHDHAHDHHHDHGHAHHHAHHNHAPGEACDACDSAWTHGHGPTPQELAGPGGWQRGLTAIVAVGLRPCSGAILLLVFALAQGLFWAGVAATFLMALGTAITVAVIASVAVGARGLAEKFAGGREGSGLLFLRGVELAAALVILAFGTLLLFGYLTAERGACIF